MAATGTASALAALATLYAYPTGAYGDDAARVCALVDGAAVEITGPLEMFRAWAASLARRDLEEAFTRTFDLSPVCALEVGWHLYGEDYNRGAFMARVREQLAERGIDEHGELPDHLGNVLPLLASMPDDEAMSFADELVLPALAAMRVPLEKESSPFAPLLAATTALVQRTYGIEQIRPITRADRSVPMGTCGKGMRRA